MRLLELSAKLSWVGIVASVTIPMVVTLVVVEALVGAINERY